MTEIEAEGTSVVTPTRSDNTLPLHGAVFITWERHRRTRGIAEYFGVTTEEIVASGPRWRRYPVQLWHTVCTLMRTRATTIIVQNPSLILGLVAVLWRRSAGRGRRVVVDAHNQAVVPYLANNPVIRWLSRLVIRGADLTLVTNPSLADKVTVIGGQACVLPDRLPEVEPRSANPLDEGQPLRVLVVATYAPDEPIDAVLKAAASSGTNFQFAFTGNWRKLAASSRALAGENVGFLGYLDDSAYWQAMVDSHVVLDLTLMPDCLVCGAYEAVAIGRPVVLSDTPVQRAYFRDAARYTIPEESSITDCLRALRREYLLAVAQVTRRREEMSREWQVSAGRVVERIQSLA